MNHPGAAHFQPAGLLANTTAFSVADCTVDRNVDPRLYEREVIAAKPNFSGWTKELTPKLAQHTFQIRHRDRLVDRQAFKLVEHPLMRRVLRFVAIGSAGNNHTHRRLSLFH